jgi:SAM-dependent methyltransferase
LLDEAGVGAGTRLLELASGPGALCAAAAARDAVPTGLDVSPEMVAIARRDHPGIDFREGDAERLPFEPGAFDAVVACFLLGHLANPEAALAEARRVLASQGALGLAWWLAPERARSFDVIMSAVREAGDIDAPLPQGPPFGDWSDPAEARSRLSALGWRGVSIREVVMTWEVGSADEFFVAYREGTVRTAGLLRAQTPDALRAIRVRVGDLLEPFRRGEGYTIPMACWVGSARP